MTNTSPLATAVATPFARRSFLKWSGIAGGAAVAVGAGVKWGLMPVSNAEASAPMSASTASAAKYVWSSCNVNCGSRCPLRLTVEGGQITRVEADDTGNDTLGTQQVRACPRGRSIRQRIYNPERLKYPMQRVGTRGEGKFKRITWDEAFDAIAASLKSTIAKYGNEAVYFNYATGATGGNITQRGTWPRLLNLLGGYLTFYGSYSAAQITAATPYTYGTGPKSAMIGGNSLADVENSELLVLWGNNPHETRMSGGGETFVTQAVKRAKNTKVIIIDPRYTDTAVTIADEWVPLRPGTDPALVAGLAHVMISENLHDQDFLDTYCVGFDEDHMPAGSPANASYKSYVLGLGPDKTEKTPDWASKITGVPVATITRLAREIAQAKPCAILQGWGPQRQAAGENTARAIFTMAIMTGNVGIPGGGTGAREGYFSLPLTVFPVGTNPVTTSISCFSWTDAIDHGASMTATADGVRGKAKLDVPIKMLINHAGNLLCNQHSDNNRTAKLLADDTKCEMVVVIDNQMTTSARYADILLPDVSNAEQADIIPNGSAGDMGYTIFADQAIDPLFECKTGYEMCTAIAQRLGIEDKFTEGKSQEDWISYLLDETRKTVPTLPTLEALRKMGIWRLQNPAGHVVALSAFRKDPKANPLTTDSGKIEIYSAALQKLADTWTLPKGDKITALPEYAPTWEGPEDPLKSKYPLQCIGHHYKARTHSSYGNVPWMELAHPQMVWINPADAKARGIKEGDKVHVYNDRGRLEIQVKVTPRIAPGVISVPQGAWYKPDSHGVDQGGCMNTLTSWHPSPLAKGNPQHTNLVEVEKV